MIPCFQWIRVQIFLICYMPFFTFFQTAGKGDEKTMNLPRGAGVRNKTECTG